MFLNSRNDFMNFFTRNREKLKPCVSSSATAEDWDFPTGNVCVLFLEHIFPCFEAPSVCVCVCVCFASLLITRFPRRNAFLPVLSLAGPRSARVNPRFGIPLCQQTTHTHTHTPLRRASRLFLPSQRQQCNLHMQSCALV